MNATVLLSHRATAKAMFEFGYDNYMRHAFPLDELNPHACSGRGVDYGDHTNININDVLGNYSVGLIDSLDSLAVMGNRSEFGRWDSSWMFLIRNQDGFDSEQNVRGGEAFFPE